LTLPYKLRFHKLDALLLLMTIFWGSNFTVVKIAVRDIPELPFNALRLLVASAAFLITLAVVEPSSATATEGKRAPRLTKAEWTRILQLGIVGQVVYQLCFLGAVTRTTVANSALIFAFTPIVVALLTAALGHERIPATRWVGACISLAGIYLVVGTSRGPGATVFGDVLAAGAMLCWALYTVGSRPMLATRSPVVVTGYSMAVGSILYLPLAAPGLRALEWSAVRPAAWLALVLSGLLALYVSYMIWYTAVQTIGSTHTSMYSNITPLVAMTVAFIWLGEPITTRKLIGAAAVIAGLAVTKLERQQQPPAES
jgi:drug/metabolite transporter (DMT)-like permease